MQPLSTITVVRPYDWGIVILWDPQQGEIPDVNPDRAVTASGSAVIVLVRHAQDVDYDNDDNDDMALAEVSVTVSVLESSAQHDARRTIFDGVLDTPSGTLNLGDANSEVVVPAHPGKTHVIVSVPGDWPVEDHHHESLSIALLPPTVT